MRKITTLLTSASTFLAPVAVMAAESSPVRLDDVTGGPTGILDFYGLMCEAANWVFAFVLVVAVIVLLFGAVSFFTARGNEDQVADARRYVTFALVGVAVAVLARSLIFVVGNFLGVDNTEGLFACP